MAYDPEATRARIIAAAAHELAEVGPAGARVDRIAAAAHVNKQGIYHYFGDKETLLAEVLRQRLNDLADAVELHPERVPDYAGALFDFHAEHPSVIRLVLWEALATGDAPVPGEQRRHDHYRTKVDAVGEAQRRGDVDSDLDARLTVLAILSLVNWQFGATQVARMVLAAEHDTPPPTMEQRRAFAIEAVRRLVTTSRTP